MISQRSAWTFADSIFEQKHRYLTLGEVNREPDMHLKDFLFEQIVAALYLALYVEPHFLSLTGLPESPRGIIIYLFNGSRTAL